MKMLPNFTLYTKDDCPWCDKAKALLTTLELPVCEFNVADEVNKERLKSRGLRTVPQIWFNVLGAAPEPEYIGGFEKLEAWVKANKEKF
jgi:glutaredoxin